MNGTLLPCPHCGVDDAFGPIYDDHPITKWLVVCDECGAQGPLKDTEQEAADAWNNRPGIKAIRLALVPFATAALRLDEDMPPDLQADDDMTIEYALYEREQPTVGDLRLALKVLRSICRES